jgi:hypothetical protein
MRPFTRGISPLLILLLSGPAFAAGGFVINNGTGNVNISGMLTVTNPTSRGVDIKNRTSGAVNFNGPITLNTGAHDALVLDVNNAAHTTSLGGTLDIDTTSGTGVFANLGGTLTATGAGNSVTATAGTAINLSSTSIGAAGAAFGTVNSTNSPTRGIYLFTVSGPGTVTTTGGSVTGAGSVPVEIFGGNVSMTYGGSITQSASSRMVQVSGGHTTGTVTFQNGTLNATNGAGLLFSDADGTYNFNGTTMLNGGDAGIDIFSGSAGTFTFGTGTSITNPSGICFAVDGGTASSTYSGNITQENNSAMVSITGGHSTGTVTFQTGTLGATNGQGLQFDNADGTYNFTGTTTLNGGDSAIDIRTGSSGTFTFGTNTAITSPTGTAFEVNSGNPSVTYSGGITQNNAQRLINIDGTTGNTIAFNTGMLTGGASSLGVILNNVNGAVSFANLNLGTSGSRMTNQAVTINGGAGTYGLGTVSIFTNNAQGIVATNADGTLNSTAGTVNATGNRAINIDGPAGLTTLGMTLTTVSSSSSPSAGITLQDTNGTFTVAGSGSAGSGGTIQNAPIGIQLVSAQGLSFDRMQLNDFGDFAIRGTNVSGFNLNNSVINGTNGTDPGADEGSIRFTGLTGSSTISNSNISGAVEDNFAVVNTSGTLNRLTLNNVTVGANSNASGGDGLFVETQGSAVINVTVQNSFFTSSRGDLLQFNQGSTGSMDAIITGTAFSDNHPAIVSGGGGVVLGGTAGTLTYNVNGNTFRDSTGTGLAISSGNAGQVTSGTIQNNIVGVQAVANSGSTGGSGIAVVSSGGGTMTAAVTGNQVYQYNNHGILLQAGQTLGNPTSFNVSVTGNTVSTPGNINTDFNGIHLNNGTVPGENFTSCVNIATNSIAGAGSGMIAPNNADFRLRQRQSTTVRLPGYGGANNNDAAVVAYVTGLQTTVTTGAASNTVGSGGGGFVGGAACVTP